MQVKEVMTSGVRLASPNQTICDTAKVMAEKDTGVLPVGENGRLVGVITDRDIAVRAVAKHLSPDTPVSQVMSRQVLYCFEDEDIEEVAMKMGKIQVRRLPVLDRNKRLVGIVSIGDLSKSVRPHATGEAIAGISQRGGAHSQTAH